MRWNNLIKLRLFLYGKIKKYYRKPSRFNRYDYTSTVEEFAYPIITDKNIRDFIGFLEKETRPNLQKVKVPILIVSANADPVVNTKSVKYIFDNIGSSKKDIFWLDSNKHNIVSGEAEKLFSRIYVFMNENI